MGSSGFVHVKNQKRKTRRTPKHRPYLLRSNMFFVTVRKTQWFNDPINLSEFAASGCPHMLSTFGQDFGSPGLFQYTQPLLVSWNILMHWSFAGNASWPCPRSHDSCQTLSRDLWATKCRKCCSMSVAGQGVRIPQVSIYNRRHAGTPSWTYLHRKIGQILGCVQNLRTPKINQNGQQYFSQQENQWYGYSWYALLNTKKPLNFGQFCLNLLLLPNLVSLAPSGPREHYLQVTVGFNRKLWSNDDWMI